MQSVNPPTNLYTAQIDTQGEFQSQFSSGSPYDLFVEWSCANEEGTEEEFLGTVEFTALNQQMLPYVER